MNCRYHGTDTAMMIHFPLEPGSPPPGASKYLEAFEKRYKSEFGFTLKDREVWVDDLRARITASSSSTSDGSGFGMRLPQGDDHPFGFIKSLSQGKISPKPVEVKERTSAYFEGQGRSEVPLIDLDLIRSQPFSNKHPPLQKGPALLVDHHHTVVVESGWSSLLLPENIVLIKEEERSSQDDDQQQQEDEERKKRDPILLTLFGHRFMGIAEQMGEALRKTAISTNVKERLGKYSFWNGLYHLFRDLSLSHSSSSCLIPRFFLCNFWARGGPDCKCSSYPRASWKSESCSAMAASSLLPRRKLWRILRAWRCYPHKSSGGWRFPSSGYHGHYPRLLPGRGGGRRRREE